MSNKKSKKMLLIESSDFLAQIKVPKKLTESIKLSNGTNGTLIVRNIPVTILNRKNENGRIYSTKVMQQAITDAKQALAEKRLLSQACEHPEASFCSPTTVSHVVIAASIKKNVNIVVNEVSERHDVLFQDWEVLNTDEGKNLRALFEAGCSVGTSIRGVGNMDGDMVTDYQILGCDCVGNPSSATFTGMPVNESVKFEVGKPMLTETFNVSTSATKVVRDLEAAGELQARLHANSFGTVVKTGTKLDSEVNQKTGATVSMTTVEAETSDDADSLDGALALAKKAMLNPTIGVDSVTIEYIPDTGKKESVTEATEKNEDKGKKFVLKAPAGFISMDGNSLVFKDRPADALHFVVGKEESGLVHLSGVEKILDAMGIYDIEKYYKRENTSAPKDGYSVEDEDEDVKTKEESNLLDGTPKNNISGTVGTNVVEAKDDARYIMKFSMIDDKGAATEETIPVTASEPDGVHAEVSNMYDMKQRSKNTIEKLEIKDTVLKKVYRFDPKTNSIVETNIKEANEVVSQDDNTITLNVDDGVEIEKEFDSSLQASAAKAALDSGDIDPSVLLSEKDELGEKIFKRKSDASDPYVEVPLNDSSVFDDMNNEPVIVELRDIDYDIRNPEDWWGYLFDNDDTEVEDIEDITLEDIIDVVPETLTLKVKPSEVSDEEDIYQYLTNLAKEKTGLPIMSIGRFDINDLN